MKAYAPTYPFLPATLPGQNHNGEGGKGRNGERASAGGRRARLLPLSTGFEAQKRPP